MLKALFLIVLAIIAGTFIYVFLSLAGKRHREKRENMFTVMWCPNCGSAAKVRGNRWECSFCGKSGTLPKKPGKKEK